MERDMAATPKVQKSIAYHGSRVDGSRIKGDLRLNLACAKSFLLNFGLSVALSLLSSTVHADRKTSNSLRGSVESPTKARQAIGADSASHDPSNTLGNSGRILLEEGKSVPAGNIAGNLAPRRSGSGGVIYGDGVSVTKDGRVFRSGVMVRKLAPGESLSLTELAQVFAIRPGSKKPRASARASQPPVGRSDLLTNPTAGAMASTDSSAGASEPAGKSVGFPKADSAALAGGTGNKENEAYPSADANGNPVFVMPNGRMVPRIGSDKRPGKANDQGGIDYGDGTSINPTDSGGTVVTGSPNGSYIAVETSTDADGNATYDLGNGTSVLVDGPGGHGTIANGGAGVEFEDGSFISVDAKTGQTVFQHADGTTEVMPGRNNAKEAANYVYVASGQRGDANTEKDANQKKDPQENDRYSGDKDTSQGDSNSKGDDEDSDDDTDSGGDDGGDSESGDTGGAEGEEDGEDAGGANENDGSMREAGLQPDGKKTADDALARKTGEKKEPDSGGPTTCGDGRGGAPEGVSQPGGGADNCVPAGLQPGSEEESEEDEESAGPVFNSPYGNSVKRDGVRPSDRVVQPGLDDSRIENTGRTLNDKIQDIEGVTNPQGN